jgi:pSer/pThr/pTyr-binding forkhead associated (FHA) protein
MIEIFISKGAEQGRSFVVKGESAQIGRGRANQVYLDEPSVSRQHAKIYGHNGQYFIEDLNSKTGHGSPEMPLGAA